MIKIEEDKLKKIEGGFSAMVGVAVVSAIMFISGIIEGIVFPKGCHDE